MLKMKNRERKKEEKKEEKLKQKEKDDEEQGTSTKGKGGKGKKSKKVAEGEEKEKVPRKRSTQEEAKKNLVPGAPPFKLVGHLCGQGTQLQSHYVMKEEEARRHIAEQGLTASTVCDILKVHNILQSFPNKYDCLKLTIYLSIYLSICLF